MARIRTRVAEGGRIVIPAEFRRAMRLNVGDEVILDLEEGQLTVLTPREAVRRAQQLVRRYVSAEHSLVAELIAERRTEASNE
ncbi:MAG TPA: AbrB/MazE/SpoVT family DNA-binding domain-containing protein [Chloroflexota bacterium]|nr:AbrB/MazE/SpoVT family DNA-binding domain-containing protein [Chloroflexota bacterium]